MPRGLIRISSKTYSTHVKNMTLEINLKKLLSHYKL
jgi:hypothetical protein